MAKNEIMISVDEESVARAAATIREAGRKLAETIGRLESAAVQPWTIETADGVRTGYVDEYSQEHWLLNDPGPGSSLRKLYVQKRADS